MICVSVKTGRCAASRRGADYIQYWVIFQESHQPKQQFNNFRPTDFNIWLSDPPQGITVPVTNMVTATAGTECQKSLRKSWIEDQLIWGLFLDMIVSLRHLLNRLLSGMVLCHSHSNEYWLETASKLSEFRPAQNMLSWLPTMLRFLVNKFTISTTDIRLAAGLER